MKNQPTLILGTAMWGWTISRQDCFALLDYFYGQGFREVDAATNYPINKKPEDFRLAETILKEWIAVHGVHDLRLMMKVGSLNNQRTPEINLCRSFLLIMLDEYRQLFGSNLGTFMLHWDNRSEEGAIRDSLEGLDAARREGLQAGLSGIRHPEVYARLNQEFRFDFRIQVKHNILQSDFGRYAPFHGAARFIAYGINAGGIKLDPAEYHERSSLKTRGAEANMAHPMLPQLRDAIGKASLNANRPPISSFNQIGMVYAFYSPDMEGILLGASRIGQLRDSLAFYETLKAHDYGDLYQSLKERHAEEP